MEQFTPAQDITVFLGAERQILSLGQTVGTIVNHEDVIAEPAVRLREIIGVQQRFHPSRDDDHRGVGTEIEIFSDQLESVADDLDRLFL